MNDEYVIIGGELYHYGVPGMKWGKRRAQAKKEYEADLAKRQKELIDKADKLFSQSKEGKWRKKHPNADADDYGDIVFDDLDYSDPKAEESYELRDRASRLDKSHAKAQALIGSTISGVFLAPVAAFIAAKSTKGKIKNGKARAAIILGSAFGSTAAMGLYGYIAGKRDHKKTVKAEGIKTVRERMKESKNKK